MPPESSGCSEDVTGNGVDEDCSERSCESHPEAPIIPSASSINNIIDIAICPYFLIKVTFLKMACIY
jgi:hypothetical protein